MLDLPHGPVIRFDICIGNTSVGKEFILNLKESIHEHNKGLVPTFRNPNGGKIIHQIDHVYISEGLFSNLISSNPLSEYGVFENKLSDHYPILTILK